MRARRWRVRRIVNPSHKRGTANARARWWRAAVVLLPAAFLGQGAWFIAANSQTSDEAIPKS